ncbi:hypothetical protein G6329_03810 [Vibrio cholerae]|uniref:Anti-sigma factor n=2 Tax=Vibrio cholerae TaxID=666 RepID=A0A544BR28_VIBCL|nr:hypothetical protein [Vibrio cholerae]EGR0741539.1 hypothetical protein [Vibrio cholerae]EGR0756042.1 hypothetical protein [Vibrio cholerae]EGR0819562.1 hypothetical protein [Vibrio cholerae]EGR1418859.1 hypothetical protein [Vibrio cholerae]EGR1860392.1 hypothetical protein [Vibrio cholerae]
MSNRLKSRRYIKAELRDKLAAEYVLGTQTPLVKRRMETLMKADPTWWEHIELWQKHLSGLTPAADLHNSTISLASPSKRVWKEITERTHPARPFQRMRWWWLPIGMAMSLFVGIWVQNTMQSLSPTIEMAQVRPITYLAIMSSESQTNHFALVAYQGDKPGQSSLRMQRNLNMENPSFGQAMVWMRDKNTGKLQLIDSLQKINDIRYMSPSEWQALKNSSELLVTANRDPNSQVLYRGHCIELGS